MNRDAIQELQPSPTELSQTVRGSLVFVDIGSFFDVGHGFQSERNQPRFSVILSLRASRSRINSFKFSRPGQHTNSLDQANCTSHADIKILAILRSCNHAGRQIRRAIPEATIPVDIASQIQATYRRLNEGIEPPVDVAVRSSATEADLPGASFADQQNMYLNVNSEAALPDTCRRCCASFFTDRAISYREDQGFDHFDIALSIAVQLMGWAKMLFREL